MSLFVRLGMIGKMDSGISTYPADVKEQSHECVRLNVESIAPQPSPAVIAGLDPAIQEVPAEDWIAGSSPAMTPRGSAGHSPAGHGVHRSF
jgi:hypothetical protein